MAGSEPTLKEVHVTDFALWERSDSWLAQMAVLVEQSAEDCQGEAATGMWVLKSGEVIVGCVGIRRRRFNGRLELCRLHVRPTYRGQGLSKRLIRHVLDHSHAHCQERVTAQVREGNAPAVGALSRFGFREISRTVRQQDGKTILLLEERK